MEFMNGIAMSRLFCAGACRSMSITYSMNAVGYPCNFLMDVEMHGGTLVSAVSIHDRRECSEECFVVSRHRLIRNIPKHNLHHITKGGEKAQERRDF